MNTLLTYQVFVSYLLMSTQYRLVRSFVVLHREEKRCLSGKITPKVKRMTSL